MYTLNFIVYASFFLYIYNNALFRRSPTVTNIEIA